MSMSAQAHACDVADLEYRFYKEPVQQRGAALLLAAVKCSVCPRRWHLVKRPSWQNAYWEISPAGPMPGAVGWGQWAGEPHQQPQEELSAQQEAREARRQARALADLEERKRIDQWREFQRLREWVGAEQFKPRVRRLKRAQSRHRHH